MNRRTGSGEKAKKEANDGTKAQKGDGPNDESRDTGPVERIPYPSFGRPRRWPGASDMTNGDLFGDFDREFERMHEEMDRMFQDAMNTAQETDAEKCGPIVYGWSMRVGSDGKPQFQQFGNTRGLRLYNGKDRQSSIGAGDGDGDGDVQGDNGPQGDGDEDIMQGSREPLTDIIEDRDKVCITAELPGVEKTDISLDAFLDKLTIKVNTEQRKYFKEVPLPAEVQPDSIEASFKNGVLDVTVRKRKEVTKKSKRVNID